MRNFEGISFSGVNCRWEILNPGGRGEFSFFFEKNKINSTRTQTNFKSVGSVVSFLALGSFGLLTKGLLRAQKLCMVTIQVF